MNKKFLISWIVIFVVWMAGSFVVHGALLGDAYAEMSELYRPSDEQQAYFPFMLAAHVILAGAFVGIYQRGREDKPWLAQGIRYGIAIALLASVPGYMIYYAVQPLPGNMVVTQIIGEGVLLILLGLIVAFLNKPAAET